MTPFCIVTGLVLLAAALFAPGFSLRDRMAFGLIGAVALALAMGSKPSFVVTVWLFVFPVVVAVLVVLTRFAEIGDRMIRVLEHQKAIEPAWREQFRLQAEAQSLIDNVRPQYGPH